jgi:8-amino-7-oxononanoate synthase
MTSVLDARLRGRLDALAAQSLYRVRRIVDGAHGAKLRVDGRDCLNFCSNDYLGLAADARVSAAAAQALRHAGTGSGAAALISGHNRYHRALEEALADFLGAERVLLFSSGWAANLGVLRAVLGREDLLLADELNHASLIDGGRLSGAEYRRLPHRDLSALDATLEAEPASDRLRLVVSDGVFSMDGDILDLPGVQARCARHGAALMIDDAHGFGVLGAGGRGIAEHYGTALPDIHVATLGKALGSGGAFVAGSRDLIEFLVQRARSWVFSTAPPPVLAAAAHAALDILRGEPERLAGLRANIAHFRAAAAERGLRFEASETAIQPLLVGAADRTMALSQALYARGFWVAGIRPPTVPAGTSRLRVALSAAHTPAQIDALLDALQDALQDGVSGLSTAQAVPA